MLDFFCERMDSKIFIPTNLSSYLSPGIGLGPRDARFHTLDLKIAHSSNWECAIFASNILYLVYR